jgi:hypothetical protein
MIVPGSISDSMHRSYSWIKVMTGLFDVVAP